MKKTLRLLVTEGCTRSCEGCCNKEWDLKSLPKCNQSNLVEVIRDLKFQSVCVTGGEPLLVPEKLVKIHSLMKRVPEVPFYLYTAAPEKTDLLHLFTYLFDGITLTLHTPDDVFMFMQYQERIKDEWFTPLRSMRLHVFKEAEGARGFAGNVEPFWKQKRNLEWVKNCPLPEHEEFWRYL